MNAPDPTTLAHAALARIREQPGTWNQRDWRCGTACCFAGHVAIEAGWAWETGPNHPGRDMVRRDGRTTHVSTAAREALGLGPAWLLFYAGNRLEDLDRRVHEQFPLPAAPEAPDVDT